jgi:hypothetical protein
MSQRLKGASPKGGRCVNLKAGAWGPLGPQWCPFRGGVLGMGGSRDKIYETYFLSPPFMKGWSRGIKKKLILQDVVHIISNTKSRI